MSAGAIERSPRRPSRGPGGRWASWPPRARRSRWRSGSCGARGRLPLYVYSNALPRARAKWSSPRCSRAPRRRRLRPRPVDPRRAAGLDAGRTHRAPAGAPVPGGFVPLMFHWQLWTGPRELTFAVLAAAFGLSLQALMRVALAAPPCCPPHCARASTPPGPTLPRGSREPWLPFAMVVTRSSATRDSTSRTSPSENHFRAARRRGGPGHENNLVWNAAHCNGPLFKTSVIGGPTSTHIGFHQTYCHT